MDLYRTRRQQQQEEEALKLVVRSVWSKYEWRAQTKKWRKFSERMLKLLANQQRDGDCPSQNTVAACMKEADKESWMG